MVVWLVVMPAKILSPHKRPPRTWYQLEVWRRRRRAHLRIEPLCRICGQAGRVTVATIVDHIVPHRGDWNAFLRSDVQSLCTLHHNSTKHMIEVRGYDMEIGLNGYPKDPRHPRYQADIDK